MRSVAVIYLPVSSRAKKNAEKSAQAFRILCSLRVYAGLYRFDFETGYRENACFSVYVIAKDYDAAFRKAKVLAHRHGRRRLHDYPRQVSSVCVFTATQCKMFSP